jgi:hypothetical protein
LTIDDPHAGLPCAARGLAQIPTQGVMHPLPDACTSPGPEIMVDGLVGRKLSREQAPLAAAPQHVEDGIEHLAHIGRARATTGFGRGNERCQEGPFRLGEIGGIALPHPCALHISGPQRANILPHRPLFRQALRGPTSYHADHFSDRL